MPYSDASTSISAAERSPQPIFLIGVCTRNRPHLLDRLLRSMAAQKLPADADVRVLIVDNNDVLQTDRDTVDRLLPFPVTLIHAPQPSVSLARNAILDHAEEIAADWILGVDDDGWVEEDWLTEFIQSCRANPDKILIGNWAHVFAPDAGPLVVHSGLRELRPANAAPIPSTCNFALPRRIFDRKKGLGMRFDPAFGESGGEDVEFMRRAERAHGITIGAANQAVFWEERTGARARLPTYLRRYRDYQVLGYRIAQVHRHKGILPDARPLWLVVLSRTNNNLWRGLGLCLKGLLLLGSQRGKQQLLRGLELLAAATAVFPYVFGKQPKQYGQHVPTQDQRQTGRQ